MTTFSARTPPAATVPPKCPSCGSRAVVTTSKVVDASTYWRCEACGEVWNETRQREAGRFAHRDRLGR